MKKFFALSLAALLAVGAVSCGDKEVEETPVAETPAEETPAEETPAEETPAEEATTGYKDGKYTGETPRNDNGMSMVAIVTIVDGDIAELFLDEVGNDGSVRGVTVNTTTENTTVGAQLDALAAAIVESQNNVVVNEDGLADGVTGSTMKAQPYLDALEAALAQAL